ncbi:MAG: aminotransferase class III-fold pyridoxal phosphate-dependent enzyme [Gammaproteobacteria bacterium]|nr:aminotransferase class III-fold pyridoxal phosphate-dependent enzyme [Gammaproteobacteria bacterium]
MKFGFIAHPTSVDLKRYVKMLDLLERTASDLQSGYQRDVWHQRNLVPFVDFGQIRSASSAVCEGMVSYMPLTAEEMLASVHQVQARILAGIDSLRDRGAQLVGLGGFTSIIGNRGLDTSRDASLPVTSGNSLTAYAGYSALCQVLDWLMLVPKETRIGIVGYPGSIGLVMAKLLLAMECQVELVHKGSGAKRESLLEHLPAKWRDQVTLTERVEDCIAANRLLVAATSAGGVIDPARLLPGAIVIDIALPRDVPSMPYSRSDVLVIDGGCVSASPKVRMGGEFLNMGIKQQINGCLAETMVLALEERAECFSIGRTLAPEKVLEIGKLAQSHGFEAFPLASYGQRIDKELIKSFRGFHHTAKPDRGDKQNPNRRAQTAQRYRHHINPVMADFLGMQHCDRVFDRAEKCTLTDTDGNPFLDMVSGYGCLNLGHNPQCVTQAIQDYLGQMKPNFVQYVSLPQETSRLAERLCEIAPGNLQRVFFSNSGTEAVEAALKTARAATGRPRFVYAQNSYHGKTLGALSVTGREKHQKHFKPLVAGCTSTPFGDLDALTRELASMDVAAFIVEPIQGEGGVRVPAAGYLAGAQEVCRRTGTLFIVDEIQTGLGRTGRMFASEWDGLEPDILVLAKSLSGGVIPIGATLSTASVWDAAYGTADRFALHTSTFGGGNIAAVAGLAAIDGVLEQRLPERAERLGDYFKSELERATANYPFITEIRGKGLMLGIQFDNNFKGAIRACANELGTRFSGNWHLTYQFFPDEVKQHLNSAIDKMEETFSEMFCLRFVTKLGNDHNILTFVTANSSTVIRIQPPLVIEQREIDRFVKAFAAVCEDMSSFLN